ncbi:MAG TPA: amino acid adenylation domain-containing protein [Thermoanaerobaculia bacterium]|nr:amino acid adenylation domain-containing protein [Thermoanaerobaculia bacterium]
MIELANRLENLSPAKRELLLRQLKKLKGEPPRPVIRPRQQSLGDFPLSYAQQRLWFLDQLEPGNPFYNLPSAVRLVGSLDEACLGRALSAIVARHESLRTAFPAIQGRPVQRVGPPAPFPLPVVDLAALPEAERRPAARALAQAVVQQPFDLAAGPLLRAVLLRLGESERIFAFALHHIVGDGWSMPILLRELTILYQAFSQGLPSPLPPLPVQYADFCLAERQWLDGEALTPQLEFWRRQLADLPSPLELPADRPRPQVQTFRGVREGVVLPDSVVRGLKELGQREGATLFMTLLAGFLALLHRYSGREDLAVGTPLANRDRVETEGLIGFFVNTLVLRGDLASEPTFQELLVRVRETVLGALAHPDLPFERLVEELKPDRNLAHSPIFQTMFVFQSLAAEARPLTGLSLQPVALESGKSLFDLTLTLEDTAGRVAGAFEYNTDLFDGPRIQRMVAHFETLLAQAVEDPVGRRIGGLPLLTAAERHQIEIEWTDTSRVHAGSRRLHEWFEDQVARTPEALAVAWGERRMTYRELDSRANGLARALLATGLGREARVGVCLARSTDLVAALLAVWKAGAAYVPLDPAYPEERLAYMLEDSGAEVLLAGAGMAAGLARRTATVIRPEEVQEGDGGGGAPGLPGNPADLAYVIYTSGSTGWPKGVAIAHASAAALLEWAGEVFSPQDLAGVLGSTSVCFDLSVFELFAPLVRGGAVILAENALELPRLPAARQVTLVNTVPSAMAELVRAGAIPPAVRTVNLAGEVLRRSLVAGIYETPTVERVLNLYGPSEDTTYSTFVQVRRGEGGAPVIGRPLANTRVYVVDAHGGLVPCGVPGEIWIGGDGLARGYLGRPGLTAERFTPDPFATIAGARLYRTGDLALWSPAGELEFLGRIDTQVKVRGFRIELGEVEVALERHPTVARSVVMASPDGQSLLAYVAGPGTAEVAAAEWRAFLRASLPEHMVPSLFVPLPTFPLTPSGKIDRRALVPPSPRQGLAAAPGHVPPRTPAEELLAGIWEGVLGVEGIGAHDGFFDLGGHSLLATQMTSRVREAFAVELPLRTLFESPTLAGFATRIEEARAAGTATAPPPLVRVPRDRPLPLSFGQQRLWFLAQLEPGSTAYNMPSTVRLEGDLDRQALAAALGEVVRRHEALRTVFRLPTTGVDEPVQEILPPPPVFLPAVDLTTLPPSRRQAEAYQLATRDARQAFDLARGPLLRAGLLRLSDREHVLLLTLHHIVSDGWSMRVLTREVSVLYAAFSRGLPSPLPELPVQYADYSAWQRDWLRGEVLETQIAYWRGALAGVPPLLDLPTDRSRPPVQSFLGAHRGTLFAADLAEEVRRLGRSQGLTSFMVLLAALQTLLHRCSGQGAVAVGSPTANRSRVELEGLIGFFANTLVLAADLTDEPTFRELLARVREASLGAYAHQDLPFEKLVEELAPERNRAHSPLFQVLFVFQNAAAPAPAPPAAGLAFSPFRADVGAAKFDLSLEIEEQGRGFAATLELNTDLFDPATACRLLEQLRAVLAAAAADPELRVSALPLLNRAQRAQLLVEWNDTAADFPDVCFHQLFAAQAARMPDAPVVIAEEGTLTWRELDGRAGQLASHLRTLGVGPEVLVGIYMERSLDMVVALLGVFKAGGAFVPLDPAYPRERLDFMLADTAARLVLTQERLAARLEAEGGPRCLCLDRDWPMIADTADTAAALPAVTPDHLAYVIYTSGSTGRPKGVQIHHRALTNFLTAFVPASGLGPDDTVLGLASLSFDPAWVELFVPLIVGGRIAMATREDAADGHRLKARLAASGVTVLQTTPTIWRLLLEAGWEGSPRFKALCGGEALSPSLAAALRRRVGSLSNLYGPTETTVWSTVAEVAGDGPILLGGPVANVEVYVLDGALEPVPPGVPGEICVGGAGLGRGYFNRPDLTAERFLPHPFAAAPGARLYRSGDLARWRPEGGLQYLGRLDHQVKVRGFRIELGEIEATLRRHPAVNEAVLVARGEPGEEQRLVAYVVGRPGAEPGVDELRRFLRAELPVHMVPWAFVTLPSLPLNANRKVDRRALPDPDRGAWGAPAEIEEPRSEMERTIAAIWRELLALDRVGIDDNFFDSGGHSLLTVRVYHRLRKALNRELPLVALFEYPTIRALARYLDAGDAGEAEPVSRQRGQDRGAKRREAAAGRRRPPRPGAPAIDHELEEL